MLAVLTFSLNDCLMKVANDRPNSRKAQAEDRRLQILDTALAVFAEKGFANTSIKDLAEVANISAGLIYHYFPSKEKLLEATVEHHSFLPQLREILKGAKDQQYREVLKNIALSFLDLLEQKSLIVKIFLHEGSSNSNVQKAWTNLANDGISLLQEYVSARIATGELRPHNAEVTARCLFSSLTMFHLTRDIFKSSRVTKSQFTEEMLDNLLRGIRSSE
jgi:AcrR family transcriptional regulator